MNSAWAVLLAAVSVAGTVANLTLHPTPLVFWAIAAVQLVLVGLLARGAVVSVQALYRKTRGGAS